jgi:ceramide glucosyltransferase
VIYLLAIPSIYFLIALFAALHWRFRKDQQPPDATYLPLVSILKPVRGQDPGFYEAIRSHALLDYPEYEILFGVSDPEESTVALIERLIREFPDRRIRLIFCSRKCPNGKAGVLIDLANAATNPILLVNDSDIRVDPDYLRRVIAPLADSSVGLVTCLYRATSEFWPGRWEAIGIATDFAVSVLVARAVGMAQFALGSTMAFRREDLARIGGFEAIGDYLADDYQLGERIHALGRRIYLAKPVVETHLSGETWTSVWRHQVRWARTIRTCQTAGYFGYVVTQAALWALIAILLGEWKPALVLLAIRTLAGVAVGAGVLGDSRVARYFFLIPLRDLWGFAVWVAGLAGSTVEWRGERMRLSRDGRIVD